MSGFGPGRELSQTGSEPCTERAGVNGGVLVEQETKLLSQCLELAPAL